ncbi:patatin-like phospholipase family protein [Nocardia sp. GTS18]|uniref:patatin-like phospholipase family protein n=1 Tax=Nocardia sp. GTS18 TaxID=1778064 RepID=UPI00351A95D8
MTSRALVIGCGGTIGAAWIVAALDALSKQLDWDPRTADLMQGTSAGAELITLLAGGVSVDELVRMQQGTAHDRRLRDHHDAAPPSLPPLPIPRLLNPGLLRSQRGLAALSGIAPTGRGDASWLARLAEAYTREGAWLNHPAARMVAVDTESGQRVAFGGPDAPAVSAATALQASWAVPGWMPPVTAGGRTYIDGGVASTASLHRACSRHPGDRDLPTRQRSGAPAGELHEPARAPRRVRRLDAHRPPNRLACPDRRRQLRAVAQGRPGFMAWGQFHMPAQDVPRGGHRLTGIRRRPRPSRFLSGLRRCSPPGRAPQIGNATSVEM